MDNEYFYILFASVILIFVVKIIYSYLDFRKDTKEFKKKKKRYGKR